MASSQMNNITGLDSTEMGIEQNRLAQKELEELRLMQERTNSQREEWERVRVRMSEEVLELKSINEQLKREVGLQRDKVMLLQNNLAHSEPENRANTGMLSGLVHGLHSMNLNIKTPKFENEFIVNPNEFMEQVKKYYKEGIGRLQAFDGGNAFRGPS